MSSAAGSAPPGGGSHKLHASGYEKPNDFIERGVYGSSPAGTATFIGLRAVDPFLQYQILANGWGTGVVTRLGGSVMPLFHYGAPVALGLPLPHLLLLGMAAGSSAKHILWRLSLGRERVLPGPAAQIGGYNLLCNSACSLLLVTAATSAALASGPVLDVPLGGAVGHLTLPMIAGTVMYAAGITIETAAEVQRKRFKDRPENAGRLCTEGLWGLVRHANYAGYTLWRTGYAFAAGGWIAGLIMGAWHAWVFSKWSIGELEDYLAPKYGEQWLKYKKDVPYALVPGIW